MCYKFSVGGTSVKKFVGIFACISMMLGLCACGGNIKNVETHEVTSAVYSQEDISSAIEKTKDEFHRNWKGCTLTELYYAGDEASAAFGDVADQYDADEVIVLVSSFDVDASGGDGSLNPNSTYQNWNWILVRADGGAWQHVDHGY
jgi:hypothetical protein